MMGCRASVSASASNAAQSIIDDVRKSPLCCVKRRDVAHVARSRDLKATSMDDEEKILREAALENAAAATATLINGDCRKESLCRTGNNLLRLNVNDNQLRTIRVKRQSLTNASSVTCSQNKPEMTQQSPTRQEVAPMPTVGECSRLPDINSLTLVKACDRNPREWKVDNERLGRRVQYLDARWRSKRKSEIFDSSACMVSLIFNSQ
jgi:hypothetical protein